MLVDLQESAVVLPWMVGDRAGMNPRPLTQLLQAGNSPSGFGFSFVPQFPQ